MSKSEAPDANPRLAATRVLNRLADDRSPAADSPDSKEDETLRWLYGELHDLANRYLAGGQGASTGRATDLVSATYEELFGKPVRPWFDRQQFFEDAGKCMRKLVAKRARERSARRAEQADFDAIPVDPAREQDLLDLEQAVSELEQVEPRYARVIELRYYAGLSVPKVAEALSLSPSTIERDWRFARAWIMRHMRRSGSELG